MRDTLLVSEILGFLAGGSWMRRRQLRRGLAKLEAHGVVDSGVRVVEGTIRGLSHEWMHGAWEIAPGRLRHYGVHVVVDDVQPGYRYPTGREAWGVAPDAEIVRLQCGGSVAEWALAPGTRELALRRLVGD